MFHAMFALQGEEEFICDATSRPRRKRTADNPLIQWLSLTLCHACGGILSVQRLLPRRRFFPVPVPYRIVHSSITTACTPERTSCEVWIVRRWIPGQGVTKRCRLSWLTNTALVYEPKRGGLRYLSLWVQLCSWAQINFGDLTPRLNCRTVKQSPCPKFLGGIHCEFLWFPRANEHHLQKTREFVVHT